MAWRFSINAGARIDRSPSAPSGGVPRAVHPLRDLSWFSVVPQGVYYVPGESRRQWESVTCLARAS